MQPPNTHLVGLLGLAMCGLGMVLYLLLLYWLLVRQRRLVRRLLPKSRSRTTYWIGMAVLAPITLAATLAMPKAIRALAVIASFGWEAYADGLRVVNKHGLLSDGRYLGVFWDAAIGGWILPLMLLLTTPMVQWHMHFEEMETKSKQ
jgi:multisubunit Na+/H+ antiporter MnhB subunit